MPMTIVLSSIFGCACFVALWLCYSKSDSVGSLLLIRTTKVWTSASRWNHRPSTPHDLKSIQHDNDKRKRIRVSGLRYQSFRVDGGVGDDTSQRRHSNGGREDQDGNAFGSQNEEVDFWRRMLQDGSFSAASMSFSYPPPPPKKYVNRFQNRGWNSKYGTREQIFGAQSYTCACNSRYGNWIEYRSQHHYRSHSHAKEWRRDLADEEPEFGMEEDEDSVTKKVQGGIDFFIAGFPKCGTTTLLHAFSKHKETSIHDNEVCDLVSRTKTDDEAMTNLNQGLVELDASPSSKRGIKCPSGLKSFHGLERLHRHSPDARIVIGVRHPVRFFESFYNYRVTEIYDKNRRTTIPPVEDIIGPKDWQGVSTDNAQYEAFLMQLGKTAMSMADMEMLAKRPDMAVKPFPFKVFLYSVEQLEDTDPSRSTRLRNDMQEFLQLNEPLGPFSRENKNHFVGDNSHPETIDICDERYASTRALLLEQGRKTQAWIRNSFLESPDVSAGDEAHFLQSLNTWSVDPCTQTGELKYKTR